MSNPGFYRAFEDRYRGSRELIGQRLLAYLPFIQPLQALHTPATALDLGCGRGEWLELLRREGWQAQGVDLDADMLADCTARGLNVAHADALSCLRAQADASLSVVSAFHVAEHLPFEALQALVAQALRVLRPGGLLILETPNPENLVVGTSGFYLDPTHLRPLPPRLLAFLPEHQGFARVCTLRLNEPPALHARTAIGLIDVLHGVSPDYAIVAQKTDAPETMAALDTAFATPVGLGLGELAQRHDTAWADRMTALNHRVDRAEATTREVLAALNQMSEARTALGHKQAELAQLQARHQATLQEVATLRAQVDALSPWPARCAALTAERDAMRRSWSWRITAPLRALSRPFLEPSPEATQASRSPWTRRLLTAAMHQVLRYPRLSFHLNQRLLTHCPGLQQRLVQLASASMPGLQTQASPGPSDGLSVFVASLLNTPTPDAPVPLGLRQHGRFHGRCPERSVSRLAGLSLDHALLRALQDGQVSQRRPYDAKRDAPHGRALIQHLYLALLRRYPSATDERLRLDRLARGDTVPTLVTHIRQSEEHQAIHRWP
ncbi:hypothetical protein CCO03_02145 [Comamonas serinivorans]|uniref:Methyltransferase type 11 domain-containing protein n=1 Tax=Comamonas serinivorans TaxID=1082851 RepID=A0A1Y0EJ87_9BURK|nr:class I SAM-dependent methyltransferase [Comamonas serinivorans]ARU03646.1 hypothetical protein CCO03_02145 [Comamonas serinivorans]